MLRDLIIKKYSNLNFELVVITPKPDSWSLDKIKKFHMSERDWPWTTPSL